MNKLPKGAITTIRGKAIAIKGNDIDTDRIIPARFLKCVSFDDLGGQVFADDRKEQNGSHPFDLKALQGASILIVNGNFGCGSSREHAPQALMRWGIRALIGESFAEIFYGNCLALGIPCAISTQKEIKELQDSVMQTPSLEWTLDIKKEQIISTCGTRNLRIDQGAQEMLIKGNWDATSELLDQKEDLNQARARLPYLNNFKAIES